jgi:hypothetical protein
MQKRLKEVVGDEYWKKAQDYLKHFVETRRLEQLQKANNLTPEQQAELKMKRQYLEQKRRQQQQQQGGASGPRVAPTVVPPTFDKMRQEIHQKREQIAIQSPQTAPAATQGAETPTVANVPVVTQPPKVQTPASTAAAQTAATTTKGGKKAPQRRKSNESSTKSRKSAASTKASAAASATPAQVTVQTAASAPKAVFVEPPREYEELMELIDHAVDYDWPSIGQLLGNKNDVNLTEEERYLLYGDHPSLSKHASTPSKDTEMEGTEETPTDDEPGDVKPSSETVPRRGWGLSNIVTVRVAWSRVRLKEKKARERAERSSAPVVAGGLLTLPTLESKESGSTAAAEAGTASEPDDSIPIYERPWFNEETAEKDIALALLSEGCQIYLRGVLEKAVQCARQRQNLDGIRLWHQQYASIAKKEPIGKGKDKDDTTTAGDRKSDDKAKQRKPPLSLRLGCDITRQVSQAQGNAAMTVKRMEEALERQPGVPKRARVLNDETLLEATSMGDLAWRPLLKEGAKNADYQAKRSFEVYGGKESKHPPLGRVPKKAKLVVDDLIMGSKLTLEGPYHKASTASSFISF